MTLLTPNEQLVVLVQIRRRLTVIVTLMVAAGILPFIVGVVWVVAAVGRSR